MVLDIRWITDRMAVAPQIDAADINEIAGCGFTLLINNRPDGEEPGQLPASVAAEAARAAGVEYRFLPVTAASMDEVAVDAFDQLLTGNRGPILAHCRSGTRSCVLWALAEAKSGRGGVDAILQSAGAAGYDLSAYVRRLSAYAETARQRP